MWAVRGLSQSHHELRYLVTGAIRCDSRSRPLHGCSKRDGAPLSLPVGLGLLARGGGARPAPAGDNSTPVAVTDQACSLCLPGDLMGM